MLGSTFLMLALAATGLAQVPAGYRKVYISSMVDKKYVVVPKSPKTGSTIVVSVSPPTGAMKKANLSDFRLAARS